MHILFYRLLFICFYLLFLLINANGQIATTTLESSPTEKGKPIGSSLTTTIGAEGGELAAPDGSIKLIIPAGAVTTETDFTIQPITNTVSKNASSRSSFRLLPEGVTFAKPIQIIFQYENEDVKGTSEDLLTVRFQKQDGKWETVPASLNKNDKSITIQTTHFSDWVVAGSFFLSVYKEILKPGESTMIKVNNIEDANNKVSVDNVLAPLDPSSEDKWTGFISFIGDWKSLNNYGKTSSIEGVKAPFENSIRFTASSSITSKGKVYKGVVTVRLKGNVSIPDDKVPSGKRGFKEFILQTEIAIINDDYYLYGTFGDKEIFYTDVTAVSLFNFGINGRQNDDVISLSMQSESGQTDGIYSSGDMAPDGEDESVTSFNFESKGKFYNYKTEFIQCIKGGKIVYPGYVLLNEWAEKGKPVSGIFSGTLYHIIEEKDKKKEDIIKEDKKKKEGPKDCPQYLSNTLTIRFKAKRVL